MNKNKIVFWRICICLLICSVALLCEHVFVLPPWVSVALFVLAYIVVAYDIVLDAFYDIIHGQVFGENLLMTIATVGAFFIEEFIEAVAVMLLYQIGEAFQRYALGKSRNSIAALVSIRPETATIVRDGEQVEVHPAEIEIGQNFLVKPGERIALDGIVVEGSCTIDTSTITGESVPVFVQKGDKVISGCICLDGTLTVQSTSDYDNCTVAQILDMVENATFNKAPAEKFITKFSRYYTPVVVVLAVLIAIVPPLFLQNWAVWIKRAMMFLFVSCPCALVISIPLGFFGGIAACSKKGILIKGSNYLEMLSKINLFAFDKTGTLTKGKFDIVNVYPQENKQQVLKLAAIAEQYSTHPIAQCILATTAPQCSATVQEIAGKGIVAKTANSTILCGNASLMTENQVEFEQSPSKTVVYVAENGKFVGYVELADQLKEDSITAIAKLHKMGANTAMLTGDNDHIAKEIATQLGIGKTYSQLLPQEKATIVQNLKAQGNKVAFVGDGINDAPVLATADVGIAMGAMGSDIAIQTADIVLMQDNPTALSTAVNISKKTLKVVKQNIVISLVIKFAVLILSAIGLLDTIAFGLVIAILADVGVCVVAILNSMRTMLPPKK